MSAHIGTHSSWIFVYCIVRVSSESKVHLGSILGYDSPLFRGGWVFLKNEFHCILYMEHQKKKKIPKDWHSQQEVILKAWGEACSCFSYMHFKAYHLFKRMNFRFMLPIIVISTVTGTANFAQDTFPENIRHIVPAVVGGFNLFAAILTTVAQFLKVSERLESHRVTAIHYGKLARNIRLELNLPISERSHDGSNMVEI